MNMNVIILQLQPLKTKKCQCAYPEVSSPSTTMVAKSSLSLVLLLLFIMTNAYSRPQCKGAQPRRRTVFGSRKRGKRRTQVHENSGEYAGEKAKEVKAKRNLRKKKQATEESNQ